MKFEFVYDEERYSIRFDKAAVRRIIRSGNFCFAKTTDARSGKFEFMYGKGKSMSGREFYRIKDLDVYAFILGTENFVIVED